MKKAHWFLGSCAVFILSLNTASALTLSKIRGLDSSAGDFFGNSVCIFGDYAIIGAPGDERDTGSAYVFQKTATGWSQRAKLTSSDGAEQDNFGYAVSVSGEYAIVGAYWKDGFKGAAYVFKRNGSTWAQQAKLIPQDPTPDPSFGISVGISGNRAAIGVSSSATSPGSAYVFKRNGATWTQEAKLTASDGVPGDLFGRFVSIDGDYAVVSAPDDDSRKGSAYIFTRDGAGWRQQAKLTPSTRPDDARFGFKIALSGDLLIVGAYAEEEFRGAAYIFRRSGALWSEEVRLTAPGREAGEDFGLSVSIAAGHAVIRKRDSKFGGMIYLFQEESAGWELKAALPAYDGMMLNSIGWEVSNSRDFALAGAPFDDNETGSVYVIGIDPLLDRECARIDDNLQLEIPCLHYRGANYPLNVILQRYANPADSGGLYWVLQSVK